MAGKPNQAKPSKSSNAAELLALLLLRVRVTVLLHSMGRYAQPPTLPYLWCCFSCRSRKLLAYRMQTIPDQLRPCRACLALIRLAFRHCFSVLVELQDRTLLGYDFLRPPRRDGSRQASPLCLCPGTRQSSLGGILFVASVRPLEAWMDHRPVYCSSRARIDRIGRVSLGR